MKLNKNEPEVPSAPYWIGFDSEDLKRRSAADPEASQNPERFFENEKNEK